MASESAARKCCLKMCLSDPVNRLIAADEARVEVRSFEPKSQNKKIMMVEWRSGGEAVFHRKCWSALVSATRVGKQQTDITLTDLEQSMVKDGSKTAEFHDSDTKVCSEARRIADILKSSPYAIAFTGAGISTAARIGDFRGKYGKWTDREKKKNYGSQASKPKAKGHVLEQLRPTYTHEALVKLMERGFLKFIISQNTDGLHRLSGVPEEKISELHGNSFIERCETCSARYQRPFACRTHSKPAPPLPCKRCKINHRTGRRCVRPGCSSYLMNTIINFGDYLESDILREAEYHALKNDTCLVLGSTLRVSPANDLCTMGAEPHRLIICNRQTTPYDDECYVTGPDGGSLGSRVFGDCDRLMREVMRCILGDDGLQTWEAAREERLVEYAVKRTLSVKHTTTQVEGKS